MSSLRSNLCFWLRKEYPDRCCPTQISYKMSQLSHVNSKWFSKMFAELSRNILNVTSHMAKVQYPAHTTSIQTHVLDVERFLAICFLGSCACQVPNCPSALQCLGLIWDQPCPFAGNVSHTFEVGITRPYANLHCGHTRAMINPRRRNDPLPLWQT